jgi:hypothetical protein
MGTNLTLGLEHKQSIKKSDVLLFLYESIESPLGKVKMGPTNSIYNNILIALQDI